MPAPTVTPVTRRVYDGLPEFYRDADAGLPATLPALTAATNLATTPRVPPVEPNDVTWTRTHGVPVTGHPLGHTTGTEVRLAAGQTAGLFCSVYNLDGLLSTPVVRFNGVWVKPNVDATVSLYIVGNQAGATVSRVVPANSWHYLATPVAAAGHNVIAAEPIGRAALPSDVLHLSGGQASTATSDYFDGGTLADPRYGPTSPYAWTGTPLSSTSTRAARDAPGTYPLLRYLSLVLDQVNPVLTLVDRFSYLPPFERPPTPPGPAGTYGAGTYGTGTYGAAAAVTPGTTSDLVDPATADTAWIPWLAQLLGVARHNRSIGQLRTALATPRTEWAHGTNGALIAAARRALTPTSVVTVVNHYQGNPHALGVTVPQADVRTVETWGKLNTAAPTWADLIALGRFNNDGLGAVRIAAEAERPAGYALTVTAV